MIKFFRKIRYKLMSENKTGKYFKYAIGEIILVVIGILIALGINNWNENRKLFNKEKTYLNKLISNLDYDVKLYKQIMTEDTLLLKGLTLLENKLVSNEEIQIEHIKENIQNLTIGYRFTTNRTTIDNLISSGQIEVLRSHYLVEKIFMYYRTTELIEKGMDEDLSNYNSNTFGPLIINSGYFNLSKTSIETIKTDVVLLNAILFKKNILNNQLAFYKKQSLFAEDLISDIRQEYKIISE